MPANKNAKFGSLRLLGKAAEHYPNSPSAKILETFPNDYSIRQYWVKFECPEFTSLCPVTGQPDFARITIDYAPDRLCIESKSLKFYLASYRDTRSFNEEIINRVLEDLVAACRPRRVIVSGEFAARGGISLTVVARYPDDLVTMTDGQQTVNGPREKAIRKRSHS